MPVTRIAFWRSKGDWWNKNVFSVTHGYDVARDWRSYGVHHRKLDYGTPTDDEEATLPPHDRATEVPDFPDTDIRDRQT